ncbi:MAG TPA: trypsin-like peptidase domain-containing protein [Gaiellales bacterium]|nr:trypsin-like peptidase domain-containing protein [Gaiellales bacterium]
MKVWLRQAALLVAAGVTGGVLVAATDNGSTTTLVHVVRQVQAHSATLPASSVGTPTAGLTPAKIYRRDAPGVVVVSATSIIHTTNIFGLPQTRRQQALGSGFVIDRQGHILTNAHVVVGAGSVRVGFASSTGLDTTYKARVLGIDRATDIAVLAPQNVPSQALDPLPLGTAKDVHVGDSVVAIGNPLGEERTITSGIISAVNRTISSLDPNRPINGALQTDAAINHGNSGGPLIDRYGRVVGITNQILTGTNNPTSGNIGIGFAVPIDTARNVARQILKSGRAVHTYLGIEGTQVTASLAHVLNLPVSTGVLVGKVRPGSPAAHAGLRGGSATATIDGRTLTVGGDVIVSINSHKIVHFSDLAQAVAGMKPGAHVSLVIIRKGTRMTVPVTLGAQSG